MPTLSTKGQIVIPSDVRRRHGWKPGQLLDFVEANGQVVVRPVPSGAADADAMRAAFERLGSVAQYAGPPIPVEKLGMEAISHDEMHPGAE